MRPSYVLVYRHDGRLNVRSACRVSAGSAPRGAPSPRPRARTHRQPDPDSDARTHREIFPTRLRETHGNGRHPRRDAGVLRRPRLGEVGPARAGHPLPSAQGPRAHARLAEHRPGRLPEDERALALGVRRVRRRRRRQRDRPGARRRHPQALPRQAPRRGLGLPHARRDADRRHPVRHRSGVRARRLGAGVRVPPRPRRDPEPPGDRLALPAPAPPAGAGRRRRPASRRRARPDVGLAQGEGLLAPRPAGLHDPAQATRVPAPRRPLGRGRLVAPAGLGVLLPPGVRAPRRRRERRARPDDDEPRDRAALHAGRRRDRAGAAPLRLRGRRAHVGPALVQHRREDRLDRRERRRRLPRHPGDAGDVRLAPAHGARRGRDRARLATYSVEGSFYFSGLGSSSFFSRPGGTTAAAGGSLTFGAGLTAPFALVGRFVGSFGFGSCTGRRRDGVACCGVAFRGFVTGWERSGRAAIFSALRDAFATAWGLAFAGLRVCDVGAGFAFRVLGTWTWTAAGIGAWTTRRGADTTALLSATRAAGAGAGTAGAGAWCRRTTGR